MTAQLILTTGDLQFSDGSQQSFAMGRNKIINGNFAVNQRAVSGTVTLSAGAYGHDRFKAGASGCTYTFATVANVTTLTISAGSLQQVIEGNNLLSGTHVLSWAGTAQGKIDGGSYAASGVTGTATGGTNLTVEFGTGTLSKVQLEQGSAVSLFEMKPAGVESVLCKRYFNVQVMHAQMASAGYGQGGGWMWYFPITMRAVPTITASNQTVGSGGGTAGAQTVDGCGMTSAGNGNGQIAFTATANAEL
jgi:hypothetical protein